MDEDTEKRKSSIELEMEKYLETELGKLDITNEIPLDLTVKKTAVPVQTLATSTTTPDLSKESKTATAPTSLEQTQQQQQSQFTTKEVDIDSQLDSLKSTDSVDESCEVAVETIAANNHINEVGSCLSQQQQDNSLSVGGSVQIVVNNNEMISVNNTNPVASNHHTKDDNVTTSVTTLDNNTVTSGQSVTVTTVDNSTVTNKESVTVTPIVNNTGNNMLHNNIVKIKINSESFDCDDKNSVTCDQTGLIPGTVVPGLVAKPASTRVQLPGTLAGDNIATTPSEKMSPPSEKITPPALSLNYTTPPKRVGTPSGGSLSPNSLQITPPDLIPDSARNEPRVSPPSRIPSRKSSNGSTGINEDVKKISFTASTSINDDLKRLESKLEKFMPKAGSDLGSETSELSEGSNKSSNSSSAIGQRLHHGQTASTRAKASELKQQQHSMTSSMTSSFRGKLPDSFTSSFKARKSMPAPGLMTSSAAGGDRVMTSSASAVVKNSSSPPDKTGTASMLKTTLRKMSRFSMSTKSKKETETEDNRGGGVKSPEVKPRGRQSGLYTSNTIGRSKSFKEPEPPRPQPISSRNQAYTSSLRRTKIKAPTTDRDPSQGVAA
jgi:hypothetical protein